MSKIPLVDLQIQHRQIEEEVHAGFERVLAQGSFILGAEVEDFEHAFAEFSRARHCVGVASGTDALELALRAAGVGRDDEVILPVNTFIATALSVARAGARPVFVDCDPVHYLIDPERAEAAVTPQTRAIVPVHLYGQMAPMDSLAQLAERHSLSLIEDAAQAQGATQQGAHVGAWSAAAATSFYPGKNLGAYGDAGAVLTSDDAVARDLRRLRNYGSEVKYHHPIQGFNSRLDTLQAVVLRAKLRYLREWNEQRRAAALRYEALLAELDAVQQPSAAAGNEHVWHLYVVRIPRRDQTLAALQDAGVGVGIHYPTPLHLTGAFEDQGHTRGEFPVAERACDEILSLPIFPGIEAKQQERLAELLRQHL